MIALAAAIALAEPMLDGRCDDHAGIAEATALGGVTAYLLQTRDHVWLCFALPAGSHGTADVRIESPGLTVPLNLHASAQLGEWAADDPEAAPKDGSSPIWGNADGWWANVVPFGGLITTPNGPRANYRTISGREMQLSKRRFGKGQWELVATISDVAGADGKQVSIRWPAAGHRSLQVE